MILKLTTSMSSIWGLLSHTSLLYLANLVVCFRNTCFFFKKKRKSSLSTIIPDDFVRNIFLHHPIFEIQQYLDTYKNYDYDCEVLFLYLNCASLSVTLSLHFSSCFNTWSSGSLERKDNTKYLAVLSFMTLQLAGNNPPQTSLHYWKYNLV